LEDHYSDHRNHSYRHQLKRSCSELYRVVVYFLLLACQRPGVFDCHPALQMLILRAAGWHILLNEVFDCHPALQMLIFRAAGWHILLNEGKRSF